MTNTVKLIALIPAVLLLTACGSGPGALSNPLKDSGIKLCEYTATSPAEMDPVYMREAAQDSKHADIKSSATRLARVIAKKDTEDAFVAYFEYAKACSTHGVHQPTGQ